MQENIMSLLLNFLSICNLFQKLHKKQLLDHIEDVHKDVPNAIEEGMKQICALCFKVLLNPASYYTHRVRHEQHDVFECEICHKVKMSLLTPAPLYLSLSIYHSFTLAVHLHKISHFHSPVLF